MRYKMIVLDPDGTSTNNKKEITPRTKQAPMQVQAAGVYVILASGRPTYGVVPLAEELKLKGNRGCILVFNGGRIVDCTKNEILSEQKLDEQLVPVLFQEVKKVGTEILTYQGEDIAVANKDDECVQHGAPINRMPTMQYDDFLNQLVYPINKCLIVGDPIPLHKLEIGLTKELEGKMNAYRSADFFLECVPLGIGEARSLDRLISSLRIGRKEVITCDNGYNDLSMIRFARPSIVMADTAKDIQSEADLVILPNEGDGVTHVTERFILSSENMN